MRPRRAGPPAQSERHKLAGQGGRDHAVRWPAPPEQLQHPRASPLPAADPRKQGTCQACGDVRALQMAGAESAALWKRIVKAKVWRQKRWRAGVAGLVWCRPHVCSAGAGLLVGRGSPLTSCPGCPGLGFARLPWPTDRIPSPGVPRAAVLPLLRPKCAAGPRACFAPGGSYCSHQGRAQARGVHPCAAAAGNCEGALPRACAPLCCGPRMKLALCAQIIFKASYDKANRTSLGSFRGPGLDEVHRRAPAPAHTCLAPARLPPRRHPPHARTRTLLAWRRNGV